MNRLYEMLKNNENNIIIYGAGKWGRKCLEVIRNPFAFCDEKAESIRAVDGIKCIAPDELSKYSKGKIILICIADPIISSKIKDKIERTCTGCEIYECVKSLHWDDYVYHFDSTKTLNINIVCKDKGWILEKFATRLEEQIKKEGHDVLISGCENPNADINHYITYEALSEICICSNTIRTTMITHVDNIRKRDLIMMQANEDVIGICMSQYTLEMLKKWGVPADKVCYINPAQDGDIHPRKIALGITNRCYSKNRDYRKRDDFIVEVMKNLNTEMFKLKIMGSDWEDIIEELESMRVEVDYYKEFEREKYKELLHSIDYWLYYGFDEGAMGFLDAVAAGVKTIATPQGYHLDIPYGLTYSVNTIDDFISVLKKIETNKMRAINSVEKLTWDNYARKHIEIWKYLSNSIDKKELFKNQSEYMDGIFSLLIKDNRV